MSSVANSVAELREKVERCLGPLAAQLSEGDIKLIFDAGIRADDELILYTRDIYVDLGLPPRIAGAIIAGNLPSLDCMPAERPGRQ